MALGELDFLLSKCRGLEDGERHRLGVSVRRAAAVVYPQAAAP